MLSLPEYVEFLAECKVDAVIVADLGVMSVVQERSEIPIHLSTQASCLNLESAKAWKDLGVKRIILGREVSIDQAARIRKESDLKWKCSSMVRCAWHFPETVPSQIILQAETAIVADVSKLSIQLPNSP